MTNRYWDTGYMKADNDQSRELSGRVLISRFNVGSKSEHEGVFIQTPDGTYLLRKKGANPFNDPGLKEFVGRQVVVTGTLDRNLFLADKIEKLD